MLAMSYYVHADEYLSEKFLCSSDPIEMSKMIEYPVMVNDSFYDRKDFIRMVVKVRKEEGIYKLGKSCKGFNLIVDDVKVTEDGSIVKISTPDSKLATLYIAKNRKIVGIIGY